MDVCFFFFVILTDRKINWHEKNITFPIVYGQRKKKKRYQYIESVVLDSKNTFNTIIFVQ